MSWLSALRERRAKQRVAAAAAQDPADLGTAFGMEAYLDPLRSDLGLPSPAAPADGSATPPSTTDGTWALHRLNARSVI